MQFIICDKKNTDQYIDYLENHSHSGIWHYPEWLNFQIKTGKAFDGKIFFIKQENTILLAGIILFQKKKIFNFGYIPGGILYNKLTRELYNFLYQNLKKIAKEKKLVFIQIDSITPENTDFSDIINHSPNHKTTAKLPIPQFTNLIDLNQPEEEILKNMKGKGRYNIKLAAKKGVEIVEGSKTDIPLFYELLKITTQRDGFSPNDLEYYQNFIQEITNTKLLLAKHEDEIIAGGIFTYTNKQALYYYGVSSNHKRNLMAPYLVQWEAMKIGKIKGCSYYDFLGIADPANKNDSLKGVTDFKLKFGGKITKFNPSYVIITKNTTYFAFNFLNKIKNVFKL